jgi:hypothetical protein
MQAWKAPWIIKGVLTWIPVLNRWRLRHASTGGSDSARYCYSVWLRHLVTLNCYGFRIKEAQVGELGPGDSIGVGLAALLSGAQKYIGLDVFPFSAKGDLQRIFYELVQMYSQREPIPDHNEFPRIRPTLDSYQFPNDVVDWTLFTQKVERIRYDLDPGVNESQFVSYRAPWTSIAEITPKSLDLIFSQAVLEYVSSLEETYRAMSIWLKPGGYASHVIDFSAHYLSPSWNGHWAYSDWAWRLARGRREFFLNREPLSAHLVYAKKFGFDLLLVKEQYNPAGLPIEELSPRFQGLDVEDLRTRGAMIVLQKK